MYSPFWICGRTGRRGSLSVDGDPPLYGVEVSLSLSSKSPLKSTSDSSSGKSQHHKCPTPNTRHSPTRVLALLEIVPSINGINITHVALQRYGGDLNICPSRLYWPHIRLMSNIPFSLLHWFLHVGRQMVFPKIWLLRSRLRVEQALDALTAVAKPLRKYP